jgi:hypothetical protein
MIMRKEIVIGEGSRPGLGDEVKGAVRFGLGVIVDSIAEVMSDSGVLDSGSDKKFRDYLKREGLDNVTAAVTVVLNQAITEVLKKDPKTLNW